MSTILTLLYISFFIYLSLVRFVYWAISKKKDCPISNEDKWNPIKWKSFAYGTFMEWLIPPHVLEQLWERYTNKDCQKCLDKGCCVNCGCNTYAKMLDPKAACSSLYWDTMMPKEQWEKRKIFLENLKQKYIIGFDPASHKGGYTYIWVNDIENNKENNNGEQ